jgi:phosphatidylserine/phosphatidylglycerophosphate/cardiolipin synthase-like enzyme
MGVTAIKRFINQTSGTLTLQDHEHPDHPGNSSTAAPSAVAACDMWIPWCGSNGDFAGRKYITLNAADGSVRAYIWQAQHGDGDYVRVATSGRYEDPGRHINGVAQVDGDRELAVSPDGSLTLYRAGDWHPDRLTKTNAVKLLPDAQALFEALTAAVRAARKSVYLMQLAFEPGFVASFDGLPPPGPGQTPRPLLDDLLAADSRGVAVRILLDNLDNISHVLALAAALQRKPNQIRLRSIPLVPLDINRLHAKVLVVDGLHAFLLGVPFEQAYWDAQTHPVNDPARRGGPFQPIHSASLQLGGPAVSFAEQVFISLWNARDLREYGGHDQLAPSPPPPAVADGWVRVVRTVPAGSFLGAAPDPDAPFGDQGILDEYLSALRNARRFIYVENQYVTNVEIAHALRDAMNANPNLQVLLLINQHPDIPLYKTAQAHFLKLIGYPRSGLGVFALWQFDAAPAGAGRKPAIAQCYLETKVAIIDDQWATVGTANLDDHSLTPGFIEINAAMYDQAGNTRSGVDVASFRRTLWGEHLQLDAAALATMPPGGWLALWNQAAAQNVARLKASPPAMHGTVLPYSPAFSVEVPVGPDGRSAWAYELLSLGVDDKKFDVRYADTWSHKYT